MVCNHLTKGNHVKESLYTEESVGDATGLQAYLKEISRHKLLSVAETVKLAWLVQKNGDKTAINELIVTNLRLVVKIAMDFRSYWKDDFLDLVQEGNIGLAKAVRKFDPDKKVKFSYYASFWIRAYIMKYLMDNKRLVKIGTTQAQRKLFYTLDKEVRRLEVSGKDPEPAEIARNLQVEEKDVVEMTRRLTGSEVSMHTPLIKGETICLGDTLSYDGPTVEEIVTTRTENSRVQGIMSKHRASFDDRERAIIDQRLLTPDSKTLKYVADQFDVSRERIRQIELSLKNKLQEIFDHEMSDKVAA